MDDRAGRRLIRVEFCAEGPHYDAGPVVPAALSYVPTVVLEDLEARIRTELEDRKRLKMLIRESGVMKAE